MKKQVLMMVAMITLLMFACQHCPMCKMFMGNGPTQYCVHEIALTSSQTYDNPYMEVDITAVFKGPNGQEVKTKGFWDGGNQFKVRFTPLTPGKWSYSIQNNQKDAGLTAEGKMKVASAPGNRNGFIRRDAKHPYHFVYDNGDRYYMFGTTYYSIILNALSGEKWKTAIDSARVFGINKYRMNAFASHSFKTHYPTVYAFAQIGDSLDFTRPEISYWQKLDELIKYSLEKGMNVDLMPFTMNGFIFYSKDIELEKKKLRYFIARYAAYPNIMWVLVNEWNYRQRDWGLGKPYWNMMGELIRAEDPYMENGDYLRPLSIHQQTRFDFQFFNYDWPTHAVIQVGVRNGQGTVPDEWDTAPDFQSEFKHGDEWGNYGIVYNLGHDMPVVNDEYGYIGESRDRAASTSKNKAEWPRFTRERHRNVMWGIATAGGYMAAGDKNRYADGAPYFSGNWHSDPPEYWDIKYLTDFFTSGEITYWKMQSRNDLIKSGERVYAFAEAGKQYLFYTAIGKTFEADIEPGEYQATRFNPRTGEYTDIGKIDGGLIKIDSPDAQDWVYFLKSE